MDEPWDEPWWVRVLGLLGFIFVFVPVIIFALFGPAFGVWALSMYINPWYALLGAPVLGWWIVVIDWWLMSSL